MKKLLFLFSILFFKSNARELTLILNQNSDTHVHYITVSWNHPESGTAQLHSGSIQLSREKHEAIIKNITEEQAKGIYITSIQAKNLKHDPKSFFKFTPTKQNPAIKIEFPDIPNNKNSEKNATYIICVGNTCPIKQGETETRTLYNQNTNAKEAPQKLKVHLTPCHDKDCLS